MKVAVRQRKYPDGRSVWTADIHVEPAGERVPDRFRLTAPAGVTSKSGAERWAMGQYRRIAAEGRPFNTRKARAARVAAAKATALARVPTLREWWPTYVEALELDGRKPASLDKKDSLWSCWLEAQFGDLDLHACCSELELQRLRQRAKDAGVGLVHATSIAMHLLASLRHAARVHPHLGLVVPKIRKVKSGRKAIARYQPDDSDAILDVASVADRAYILLMLDAGLRAGEVCALKWSDIDVARCSVTVEGTVYEGPRGRVPRRSAPLIVAPKGGEARTVPLTTRALAALQNARSEGPWVCPAARNPWPSSYQTLSDRLHGLADEAGVVFLGCHAWRHTFATDTLRAGVDLETLRKYLGHQDIATTAMYLHSSDEEAVAGIKALEASRAGVTSLARARRARAVK